jgi:hypothetical protein
MPSPFPGMDPYLEDPAGWPNLHVNLITEIQAVLNRQLRPNYYARAEDRVYISDQDDPGRRVIAPDVRVLAREEQPRGPWVALSDTSMVAVAEPVEVVTLIEDEIRELRVEVIDASQRQVVTVIEVLSPANKVSGARGQQSYRRKRAEVLASQSHWVEVDLLRDGERLVAAELMPRGDYFVHVSRVERRPAGTVWPIRLPQSLPVIPIPLHAPDPDAKLDLQQVLTTIYDRSSYDLTIDYGLEPTPPLPREYAPWADRLLRDKGLR